MKPSPEADLGVDLDMVWLVVSSDLPALQSALLKMSQAPDNLP